MHTLRTLLNLCSDLVMSYLLSTNQNAPFFNQPIRTQIQKCPQGAHTTTQDVFTERLEIEDKKGNMITARNEEHIVTRNSTFFKKLPSNVLVLPVQVTTKNGLHP